MDIINKIAVAKDSFVKILKKDIVYAAQFSLFVVTLGHYAPPRVKNQQSLQAPVPETPIDTRTLSQEEANKLLDHLLPAQREAFEQSIEFQEYQNAKKDDDGTNPFYSINLYYQQYHAKSFINENHADQVPYFFLSPEYQDYLLNNPFSSSIEDVYHSYDLRLKTEKAYAAFEKQRLDSYLNELKKTISPEEFQKFTESEQYFSPQYNTTVEGMKVAYAEFNKKSQSAWWPKSLW